MIIELPVKAADPEKAMVEETILNITTPGEPFPKKNRLFQIVLFSVSERTTFRLTCHDCTRLQSN